MPIPTKKELKNWANEYVRLWNNGDKEAWAANWKSVAPGDFRMYDPIGTPIKEGFEHCALDSFDLFQPNVHFRILPGSLFICDNEVAWTLENAITSGGETQTHYSIETYRFEEDGSVLIRTYYNVPPHTNDELGEMFKTYLP